jgi:hypothetical protein
VERECERGFLAARGTLGDPRSEQARRCAHEVLSQLPEEDARVDTEITPERLVLWFSTDYNPKAELDGNPVQPAWV